MPKYNSNIRSVIEGLSDFWLLYFKEIDQLEAFYRGTEIMVGQSYLDMLTVLLNNSVSDTSLFDKEYFKLFQIAETDIIFREGRTPESSRYIYDLPDNAVIANYLNNKVLEPTQALERNVDYFVDETIRDLEFTFDPLNAYRGIYIGQGNARLFIRENTLDKRVRVSWTDTGGPLAVSRVGDGFDVAITYDGPANTSTDTAADIVQAINTHVEIGGLLVAELPSTSNGTGSPVGNGTLIDLTYAAVNPINGFATRPVLTAFGAKFTVNEANYWVNQQIQKGDTLRLVSGPTTGVPVEYTIRFVRPDAVYVEPGGSIGVEASDKTEFTVLRAPENNTSSEEALSNSGDVVNTGADGTITAATRTLDSPTLALSEIHEGDLIQLIGTSNSGFIRILSVPTSTSAVLASTNLVDETPLTWLHHSVVDSANTGTDGVLTNNGDGTASFTAASATFTAALAGNSVIKIYRAGSLELYAVTDRISGTEVTISAASTVADGASLIWGWANKKAATTTLAYSPPIGLPVADGAFSNARRLLDNTVVENGVDFQINEDTGQVDALTVWQTAVNNVITYDYRKIVAGSVLPIAQGIAGRITPGSPNTFYDPSAPFTSFHVGNAIVVSNSDVVGGVSNNGVHFIAAYVSSTTVELTDDRTISTIVDSNNDSLVWELQYRTTFTTENIEAQVQETAFWAPDVLIDRFHLYNTYGYLINRFDQSSETYRSLIQGIFQLFILGPTLERFESAINTVAGIPVIRDDGELLLGYSTGGTQSGTDGVFEFSTSSFTSPTALFTQENNGEFLFIESGVNAGKAFEIIAINSATTVTVSPAPVSDTAITWELNPQLEQTVETSRTTYTFSRILPIKEEIKDSANVGLIIFKAFEVMTRVFEVTDHVETPTWWQDIQIPEELMPDESSERRQSTRKLFENVIGAPDDPRIGDPGFIIGADSEGFVPPSIVQYTDAGNLDGELFPDPLYPTSQDHFFEATVTAAFSSSDIGNLLVIDPTGSASTHRIIGFVNSGRVQIESFVPLTAASGLDWEVRSSPVPLRHKMAFIVLDRFLKQHLFSVQFDTTLLTQLSGDLIADLQELVFVAKPAHTFIVLTPSSFFQEIVEITEDMVLTNSNNPGGDSGELISVNASPLTIQSNSWAIGSWYRYLEVSSSFSAPAASISNVLGTPDAGYKHTITKWVPDYSTFTSGGEPINTTVPIKRTVLSGADLDVAVTTVTTEYTEATVTFSSAILNDCHVLTELEITSGTSVGTYYLGAILSPTTARISGPNATTTLTTETGLSFDLRSTGSCSGTVSISANGETYFEADGGVHTFNIADSGTYIRRPFVSNPSNQVFHILEVLSNGATTARLAEVKRVSPSSIDSDHVGAANNIGPIPVLELTPSDKPIYDDGFFENKRFAKDPSTYLKEQYYVVFTSGVHTGVRRKITDRTITGFTPERFTLDGLFFTPTDSSVSYYIEKEVAYDLIPETTNWEHVQNQVIISDNDIDLSNTPTQDAGTVNYTAYGVREPIDPSIETIDVTAGDTEYHLGMPDPRPEQGRTRTAKETDMREDPIQITRT